MSDAPLVIAYSDWPGWVAFDIALEKGWFEEEGVRVDFEWFDYVPSMEAFAAGKVDAVTVAHSDVLVMASTGTASKIVLMTDMSNGNDMIVARPGITRVAQLKGKRVGVEVGFVSHLLLEKALESAGLSEADIKLVNMPTDALPAALEGGTVDAIAAWPPASFDALRKTQGSSAIYTTANSPGLLFDVLTVSPTSLAKRREDWKKVLTVWFRTTSYLAVDAHREECIRIMSERAGVVASEYSQQVDGTRFLGLTENALFFMAPVSPLSLRVSLGVADNFQVARRVYPEAHELDDYVDGTLVDELMGSE